MRSYINVALYGVDQRLYSCTVLDKSVERAVLPSICKLEGLTSAEGMCFNRLDVDSNDKFLFYYKISDDVIINGYKGGAYIFSVSDNSDIDFFKEHWAVDFCMLPEWFKNLATAEKVDSVILKNLPYFQSWGNDTINNKTRADALSGFEYGRSTIAVVVDKLLNKLNDEGDKKPICLTLTDENCEDKIEVLRKAIVLALKCLPCNIANKISYAINSRNDIENVDIFCTANVDSAENINCMDLNADWSKEPIKNPYAQYIRDFHDDPLRELEKIEDINTLNVSVSPKVLSARCDEVLKEIEDEQNLNSLKSCIDLDKYSDDITGIKLVRIAFSVCFNYRLYHNYYDSNSKFFEKWLHGNDIHAYPCLKNLPIFQVVNIYKSLTVKDEIGSKVEFVNFLYDYYETENGDGIYKYAKESLRKFFYRDLSERSDSIKEVIKQFWDKFDNEEKLAKFISGQESLFKGKFFINYLQDRFKEKDLEERFDFYKKCSIKNSNISVNFLSVNKIKNIETLSDIYSYFKPQYDNIPKKIKELLYQHIKQCINEKRFTTENITKVSNKIGYKISNEENKILESKMRSELEELSEEKLLGLFNGNNNLVYNDDMLVDYVCEKFKPLNLNARFEWFKKCSSKDSLTEKLAKKFFYFLGDFNNQDIQMLEEIYNYCKEKSSPLSNSAYESLSKSLHKFIVESGKNDKNISSETIKSVASSIGYNIKCDTDVISSMKNIENYERQREQKKWKEEIINSLPNHLKMFAELLPEQTENQAVCERLKERKHGETGTVKNSNVKWVVLCDVLLFIVYAAAMYFIIFMLESYLKQHFLIDIIDSLLKVLNFVGCGVCGAAYVIMLILQRSKFGQFKACKRVCAQEINRITIAIILFSICVYLLVILLVFSFI